MFMYTFLVVLLRTIPDRIISYFKVISIVYGKSRWLWYRMITLFLWMWWHPLQPSRTTGKCEVSTEYLKYNIYIGALSTSIIANFHLLLIGCLRKIWTFFFRIKCRYDHFLLLRSGHPLCVLQCKFFLCPANIFWLGFRVDDAGKNVVAHLSMRSACNTMATRGTLKWHLVLVAPLVRANGNPKPRSGTKCRRRWSGHL